MIKLHWTILRWFHKFKGLIAIIKIVEGTKKNKNRESWRDEKVKNGEEYDTNLC